jgi:hypothetical protein
MICWTNSLVLAVMVVKSQFKNMVAIAIRVSENKTGQSALSFLKAKRTILNLQTCMTRTNSLAYNIVFLIITQKYIYKVLCKNVVY